MYLFPQGEVRHLGKGVNVFYDWFLSMKPCFLLEPDSFARQTAELTVFLLGSRVTGTVRMPTADPASKFKCHTNICKNPTDKKPSKKPSKKN